ncbi:hypothetical protein DFH08DRAFT_1073623 [Mycena albidolilacea]|uniref:Uncharacterized protein n=1 Tax=Mycena albidolilacea TaxID=1033008 RepID=A0AAD7AMX6_9AGAR|nr:hypothetical protein DFH08DRAFT_1073623 [Mycena albidolilacea]
MKFTLLLSTISLLSTTALAASVSADQSVLAPDVADRVHAYSDCKPGLLYCGHFLKTIGNYDFIIAQSGFDAGAIRSTLDDSLFHCSNDLSYVGYITYVRHCGTSRCKQGATNRDDYCV